MELIIIAGKAGLDVDAAEDGVEHYGNGRQYELAETGEVLHRVIVLHLLHAVELSLLYILLLEIGQGRNVVLHVMDGQELQQFLGLGLDLHELVLVDGHEDRVDFGDLELEQAVDEEKSDDVEEGAGGCQVPEGEDALVVGNGLQVESKDRGIEGQLLGELAGEDYSHDLLFLHLCDVRADQVLLQVVSEGEQAITAVFAGKEGVDEVLGEQLSNVELILHLLYFLPFGVLEPGRRADDDHHQYDKQRIDGHDCNLEVIPCLAVLVDAQLLLHLRDLLNHRQLLQLRDVIL